MYHSFIELDQGHHVP